MTSLHAKCCMFFAHGDLISGKKSPMYCHKSVRFQWTINKQIAFYVCACPAMSGLMVSEVYGSAAFSAS